MAETPSDKRQRDFNDLQNEAVGRDTGRIERFGIAASHSVNSKEREKKRRAFRDQLERLLLTDPAYRQLYQGLGEDLRTAETEADTTIAQLTDQLARQSDLNAKMRGNAARGPDGGPIFRFADGRVVDENGQEIAPEIAEGILWPEGAPSAEDYFEGIARADALAATLAEWDIYRTDTLGEIRHRYEDRYNQMSVDDLRDAIEEIERAAPDVPEVAAIQSNGVPTVAAAPTSLLTLDP